jgi:hypothetical protein
MFLSNIDKYGFTMFTYGGDSAGYFLYYWGTGGGLCGSGRGIISMGRLELLVLFYVVLDRNCWFKLWILQLRYGFVFC